jgi:hypothetical protein
VEAELREIARWEHADGTQLVHYRTGEFWYGKRPECGMNHEWQQLGEMDGCLFYTLAECSDRARRWGYERVVPIPE